jgi:hypothetical protein
MRSGEEQTSGTTTGAREAQQGGETASRRRSDGGRRSRSNEPARLLAAIDEARQSITDFAEDLRTRVQDQPVKTLAMALGAGYILGGGLFSALTGRLVMGSLKIGLRLAALPVVREELLGFVETVTDRGRGETERREQ